MKSSQSEEERNEIREKMKQDESLSRILKQLDTGKADEEETSASQKTARRNEQMQEISESAECQVPGHRQMLNLDDIVFTEGSHFMSNKKCQLPDGSFRKARKGNCASYLSNKITKEIVLHHYPIAYTAYYRL